MPEVEAKPAALPPSPERTARAPEAIGWAASRPAAPEGGAPGSAASEPRSAQELWSRVVELAGSSVRTRSMLEDGRPLAWSGAELTVEVAGPTRAVMEHRREEVEGLLRRAAGRKVSLAIVAPASEGAELTVEVPASAEAIAREHPLVKHAIELFGGRVEAAYFKKRL